MHWLGMIFISFESTQFLLGDQGKLPQAHYVKKCTGSFRNKLKEKLKVSSLQY